MNFGIKRQYLNEIKSMSEFISKKRVLRINSYFGQTAGFMHCAEGE